MQEPESVPNEDTVSLNKNEEKKDEVTRER